MTNEEIKRNAFEYSLQNCCVYDDNGANDMDSIREAYTDGAHSRDEEIEKMQKELNLLRHALSTNKFDDVHGDILTAYGLLVLDYDKRGSYLQDLEKELEEFRNQWISVNKRLPEKRVAGGITFSVSEFILFEIKSNRDYLHFGYYDTDKKLFCSMLTNGNKYEIDYVMHWMYIPELQKGN